jgi:hypothetical protein
VYAWSGETVRAASWPPRSSRLLTTFAEPVADLASIPGGIAALLTRAGTSWDNQPRLALAVGRKVTTILLPDEPGQVTARSLRVSWPTVVVRTYIFTSRGRQTVQWRSVNGGHSWRQA